MAIFPLAIGAVPFDWDQALRYLSEMFNERVQAAFNCSYFPPNSANPGYPLKSIDSVTDNHDGTVTVSFSGLDPDWTSGQWTGSSHEADCPAGLRYNLIIFGDIGPPADPYQQVSGFITSQTQDATAHTGTLTISPSSTFLNAITAGFITSLSQLSGKFYTIAEQGYASYLDRRWLRPNDHEAAIGQFDPGWAANLVYDSGTNTEKFDGTGNAPFFPVKVFFQAVSGSHKMAGTLILNADGSFSGATPSYTASAGTNTPSLFDHTIWPSVSFSFCKPTFDPATGIGQIQQFIELYPTSPYDNAPGDPPQPPHTDWKIDLYKGMDFLAFDNAGGVGSAFPDPSTFPLSLGHDYTSPPTVTPSGGSGSGGAITAVLGTSTAVVYLLIVTPGLGYTTTPSMSIANQGSSYAAGHLVIDGTGAVIGAILDISGTGFTSELTVTVDAPPMGGTQAVVRAILGTETVASYNVTNPGNGYVIPPNLALSGGGGADAAAVCTLNGATKLLATDGAGKRPVVAGNDEGIIYLGKRPSDSAYAIPASPIILDAGQQFIVLKTGLKGMPGRIPDIPTLFYAGSTDPSVSRMPWDASLTLTSQMSGTTSLQTLDANGDCDFFEFLSQDIDVTYPQDSCNCGRQGFPVNVNYWKTIRSHQAYAVYLLTNVYINPATLGQSTPPRPYTFAELMTAIGAPSDGLTRVYRRQVSSIYGISTFEEDQDDNGSLIDPPVVDPGGALPNPSAITLTVSTTGGALTHNTTYAYRVSYFNASGETLASAEQTIATPSTPTADTYSISIGWAFQVGAEGANVYGRTASGEQLIMAVSMPTLSFVDDGSVTPSGALPTFNTTHNDCNGTGTWIKRNPSVQYQAQSNFGYAEDAGGSFFAGDYVRYMGDNATDPFPGGDRVTVYSPVESRAFRGRRWKVSQLAREASQKGTVVDSTANFILDTSKNWWTDESNNGTLRIQGGVVATGSGTSITITSISGDALCWWNAGRYSGFAGIWCEFILEVYAKGAPAGWTIAADGTATYSAPTPPGNTSIPGLIPVVTSVGPSILHAIGKSQPVWFHGTFFDPAATIVLTNTSTSETFSPSVTVSTYGEISLSFNFGFVGATWSIVVTNPGPHSSSAFTFTVNDVNYLPITSGTITSGTGTLGFSAVTGLTINGGDGWLIREPAYELNKWKQRTVKFTKDDGTFLKIPCRFSSNERLFFDTQTTPFGLGWTYQIIEYTPGPVLKFSSSPPTDGRNFVESIPGSVYWSEPYILDSTGKIVTGSNIDARGGGNFVLNLNNNLATMVSGDGYMLPDDDFTATILNQIHDILALAKDTANFNPACRNIPAIGATAENNVLNFSSLFVTGPSSPGPVPPTQWGLAPTFTGFSTAWGNTAAQGADLFTGDFSDGAFGPSPNPPSQDPGYTLSAADNFCPEAMLGSGASNVPGTDGPGGFFTPDGVNVSRAYAYLEDSGIPICLTCTVNFWVHSIITTGDPNEGLTPPAVFPNQQVRAHFDPQGTPLQFRKYVQINGGTSAKDGTGIIFSGMVGNATADVPTWTIPDDPTGQSGNPLAATSSAVISGYKADAIVSIRTWVFQFN